MCYLNTAQGHMNAVATELESCERIGTQPSTVAVPHTARPSLHCADPLNTEEATKHGCRQPGRLPKSRIHLINRTINPCVQLRVRNAGCFRKLRSPRMKDV